MRLDRGCVELVGPDGGAPWYLEVDRDRHPLDAVVDSVASRIGPPRLVHSTSWRLGGRAVILSFVAVVDGDLAGAMTATPARRVELARCGPTASPTTIDACQIVEHGLRHLAWLARDDPMVCARLSGGWAMALEGYRPEPARLLG